MGTIWQGRFARDRVARCDQHTVLRRNGAKDTLVAIRRLPHDFVHAVVHRRRRVWHRVGVRIARPNLAARLVAHGDRRRCDGRNLDFRLLRNCILPDGSLH